MPFNSVMMVSVAKISADVWQQLACLPERIGSEQLLDLVICFPMQQLGRWALFVWNHLCVSPYPTHHHASYYYHTSDSDYSSDDDSDPGGGGGGGGCGCGCGCGGASSSADSQNQNYYYYCHSVRIHQNYDSSSHSD